MIVYLTLFLYIAFGTFAWHAWIGPRVQAKFQKRWQQNLIALVYGLAVGVIFVVNELFFIVKL